jgi:hypothetical protein
MSIEKPLNPILSIDWDWVTGDCASHGDGHAHCGWCAWAQRDRKVKWPRGRGLNKALRPDWEERLDALSKLTYRCLLRPKVYVAECHADIMQIIAPRTTIYHLDEHKDCAKSPLCCGSWVHVAKTQLHCAVHRINMADVKCMRTKFPAVFLCKSSSFTPKKADHGFYDLIRYFMCAVGFMSFLNEVHFIGHRAKYVERGFAAYMEKWNKEK